MCGILGIVDLQEQQAMDQRLFIDMCDSMAHRGPDGDGFFFAGKIDPSMINDIKQQRPDTIFKTRKAKRSVCLGHRRLSIIDLAASAGQPMGNHDESIQIVFNGEIYNHREIRRQLLNDGYLFKTDHSDTETIIHAYEKWGFDALEKLRGDFAFGIWDANKDMLWLARDRSGVKPLYYTIQNNRLYFASEIKAILKDRSVKRELNEQGLYHYLSFLTVPAPETLFKGIYKLPAGFNMKIKAGHAQKPEPYWDVFDNVSPLTKGSEARIKEELIYQLRDSVKCRLESDVPVGVFLSGGIDSSTNAALFSEITKQPVRAFSIGYKEDHNLTSYKNEFTYARKVSDLLGCDYHELELSQQDLIDFLPDLIHHQDEPIADPVCVPVYFVSKLARDNGVTVCQVGEGADELFWGYDRWKAYLKLQNLNDLPVPGVLKRLGLAGLKGMGKDHHVYYELLRRGASGEKVFWSGAEAFYESGKKQLLGPRLKEKFNTYSSWEVIKKYHDKFLATAPEPSHLNWMSYVDLKLRLPELLLMRVDKMSMAVSLEGRVPFLDHKFIEYAMSIPSSVKTKDNESKHILKKSVEGIIPDEVIYRKKQGFGAPVYEWFMEDLGRLSKSTINQFNKDYELFDQAYIDQIYRQNDGTRVWYLLNLAMWANTYLG